MSVWCRTSLETRSWDVSRLSGGCLRAVSGAVAFFTLLCAGVARAEDKTPVSSNWHYGAYLDGSYPLNFNFPENHKWRSKITTPRTNEFAPNMAMGYVRKDATPDSRWGLEAGGQGGYDTSLLVPSTTPQGDKPVPGADVLRYVHRANVSYLAPLGNGLKLTAGLFNSFIGYESFLSRNNSNYTRSYMADNAPYFMTGLAAQYPVTETLQLAVYVINGYNNLSRPNLVPSYGTQVMWKPAPSWTLTQNFYYGPDQFDTSLTFWRFFSDSIIEWKDDAWTVALAYDAGTENAVEQAGHPRLFWTSAALFVRRHVSGPWSVAFRPELYWDRNGRLTGAEQLITAVTSTLEYRIAIGRQTGLLRLEYRFDRSTGSQGGFYTGGEVAPGVAGLTPNQNLVILGLLWAFDS
ncbi:outer membrane beta-barrel protein [Nitrospira sp. NS4]|uniref:outer membrane beta-barrel protein n=1 Tax=Nitrospira sp. NS4 TaxID=3414498 RepID=UPI003C2D56E3